MDRPYNTTRRIIKTDLEGKNHRERPRLEYVQKIINDQVWDSYVQIKGKQTIEKSEGWLQTNQRIETIQRERERERERKLILYLLT